MPANRNLEAPVQIGGQTLTITLVPVLLPPHKTTANARLSAIPVLVGLLRTWAVSGKSTPRGKVVEFHLTLSLVELLFRNGTFARIPEAC